MATFCDIAGIEDYESKYSNGSDDDYFDGISIYPTLVGEEQVNKHDHLYWEFHETNMIGVRKGNWKLVVKGGTCYLYDLATDLHEDTNLASKYPAIVNELIDCINQDHIDSSLFKVTIPSKVSE